MMGCACFLQWLHRAGLWHSSDVSASLSYASDMRWLPLATEVARDATDKTHTMHSHPSPKPLKALPLLGISLFDPVATPVGRFCVSVACRYWSSMSHPHVLTDTSKTRLQVLRDFHVSRVPWSERHVLEQRRQFNRALNALLASHVESSSPLLCNSILYNPSVNLDFDVCLN
jgi:hypothetical protein